MNTTTKIYVLIDPRDDSVFYVGRTTVPLNRRLQSHIKDGRKERTAKGKYIAHVLAAGLRPQIREIESFTNISRETAIAKEEAWQQFYGINYTLANTGGAELGGHGTNAQILWTPETLAMLGKYPDEQIALQMKCDRCSQSFRIDD